MTSLRCAIVLNKRTSKNLEPRDNAVTSWNPRWWRAGNLKAEVSSVYKQLLDEVFVRSRIIKVEVRVISRSRRLRLITLTETLIILDITKTESNNCFIIHWTENLEVMFLPLHWRQATRVARSWHDYPWKSCTAVIHDMITRDLDMITRDLDMIIV